MSTSDAAMAAKAQAFARSLSFDGYYRQLCQLLPILEAETNPITERINTE